MRVLLTGHKGYIGCVLAPMLVRAGHDLTGLDSDLYCRCTFVGEVPKIPEIKKDVRDLELADVSGYDAVIHLAGLSSDPLGDLDPELTYAINHASSVRLAVLAKEAGVARFVFASTCSVYGAAGDQPIDETGTVRPLTPYGKSKWLVERDVSLLADSKFSPTFLRSATAYGVSPRLRFDLVLNNLVAWAHTTGQVYLKSDGTPWRPLVHVEDIARAYLAVLDASREKVHNKALNVGRNDENYRIGALAGFVVKTVPNCRIESGGERYQSRRFDRPG